MHELMEFQMNEVEKNVLEHAKLTLEIGSRLGLSANGLHKISPDVARQAHQRVAESIELLQFIERILYDRASERGENRPTTIFA